MLVKKMTGSEIVLKALRDQGVTEIFGYPGGAVLPIYDALFQQNKIRHVLVRQEGGAVHAAEGYARSTGKVGVVLVTSGPGATNAVTGLLDAFMDSVPIICLTGQVPTHLIGNDAFQEADTTGITRPCTKHNYLVKNIEDLARIMHEAFHVARSGRPGPVVIDLPKDILMALGSYVEKDTVKRSAYKPQVKGDITKIKDAIQLIKNAKKPIIYAGGGVINSGPLASKYLTRFVKMTGFPCTLTLMGLGAYPASDRQFVGMLGMHGTYEANLCMNECDLMIAIGARFDDRITGRLDSFSPGSKKIQIDIDPSSINKNVPVDIGIIGDISNVLKDIVDGLGSETACFENQFIKKWWGQIENWRKVDCLGYKQVGEIIKPQYAIQKLFEHCNKTKKEVFVTTEVGQHQMWAAQYFGFDKPNRWLTSGGLGTMGYGLPASMGVQVAHPQALVVGISGEASFMMNMQELSTISQYQLPVKCFILNNFYMGMVRQWQELLHGSRYSQSYMDSLPDFVKLAESFGMVGIRATKVAEVDDVIGEMIEVNRPVIADIQVDPKENVFPMIPSGAAHNEMLLGPNDEAKSPVSEEGMVLV